MKDRTPLPSLFTLPRGIALCACFAAGMIAMPLCAADDKPAIDLQADALLKRMGDYLGQAQFFSVNVEIWQDVDLSSGQRVQADRAVLLQVRRPDCLHTQVHSTRRNHEMIYDGQALTLFNRAENFYGTAHVTGSLDDAMDAASERFGINVPLEDFIRSDPYKDLIQNAVSGVDIGPVTVMGVPCEHLAFSQTNIDWQVWVEDGPRPIPRKFLITYKDEENSPQFTAVFSDWDFNTPLPDFVFKFEPPAGAMKIKVSEIKAENESREKEAK